MNAQIQSRANINNPESEPEGFDISPFIESDHIVIRD